MASDNAAATLGKASGSVYVERQGTRISLAEGDIIRATDKVVTDQGSTAEIRFNDGSTASLSPGTTLEVKDFSFGEGAQPSFILNLAEGTMRSVSGELVKQNPEAFKIITPQATVGIRGTELFTAVMPGGQEVHAVLHIGKGHIVSITSHDGRSIVMDSALQAVNMSDGEHGALVKQTFQLNELQQVIKNIAPTQVQKPIQPRGVEGEVDPTQPGQPGQSEAAPAASATSTVVVIIHEGESATNAQIASENTATGAAAAGTTETLLATVEQLQGALADAGFTVTVTSESALQNALGESTTTQGKSSSDVLVSETVQENVSQVISKPTDNGKQENTRPSEPDPVNPDPPVNPDRPVNPNPPVNPDPPVDHDPPVNPDPPVDPNTLNLGEVTEEVVAAGSRPASTDLKITVTGNVSAGGKLVANSDNPQATWGSDEIIVNGSVSGGVYGDGYIVDDTASPLAQQTFGEDTFTITGTVTGEVYGDVREVKSQNVVFGNDSIQLGTLSGASGVVAGDALSLSSSNATCGNDTIIIGSISDGAIVYGDVKDITIHLGGPTSTVILGSDTILVQGDVNGTIVGDAGSQEGVRTIDAKDIITVGSFSGGNIYGDSIPSVLSGADDTITVRGNMTGGTIHGAGGNDTINVGGVMSGGTINASVGNDSVTVGSLSGGDIFGDYSGATSGGNDTIEVRGDMSGGFIHGGPGNDIIHVGITTTNGVQTVTGTLSNGTITGGTGDDTIATGSITVAGNNAVNIDGGAGTNTINTGVIAAAGNANVLITGGGGTDTITTGAITAAAGTTVSIDAGAGSDAITIGGYQGEGSLNIDLGNDSVRDTLSLNASTIQGDITINNYKLTQGLNSDSITIAGLTENTSDVGSQVRDISLIGNTFTMRMLDNSVVTITGDFGTTDATDVYRTLVAPTQP